VHSADKLLIHAAAGGVGTFAFQQAVAPGAGVIATASKRNFDYLRSIGAEPVAYGDGLLDRVRAIAPRGVDAVLDTSGRGEIPLSIVLAGGAERVLTLVAVNAAAAAVQVYAGGAGSELRPALREIACPIEQGRLTVPIWPTFPLTQSAVGCTPAIWRPPCPNRRCALNRCKPCLCARALVPTRRCRDSVKSRRRLESTAVLKVMESRTQRGLR